MSPLSPVSPAPHVVLGTRMPSRIPDDLAVIDLAMGCFWGAERLLWSQPGVVCTAVGYCGGDAEAPSYREVCGGGTGHAETVRVLFSPARTSAAALIKVFFDHHDPSQGDRQGNDVGSQYRSVIFTSREADYRVALAMRDTFAAALATLGKPMTTSVFGPDPERRFWMAEDYHQQYLAKNPDGYCGLRGTGLSCPLPA